MPFPTKVKVGMLDYKIRFPTKYSDVPNDGDCNNGSLIINVYRVNPRTHAQMAWTLLHEIMHAIHWVWEMPARMSEETAVRNLSTGLSTVWRDNPKVIAWINEGLK